MAAERLEALTARFRPTREALHRVAEELVAPARKPDNEIALKATPGGFGTPVFEFDGLPTQVRVDGAELVIRRGGGERRAALTTIAAGAELVGADLFPRGPPDDTAPLEIDRVSAEQLGSWFALGDAVLGELRAEWSGDEPSEVNLWPEHFDIAIEAGREAGGGRANYGFSPGDEAHEEPYLYVGPWNPEVSGDLWNAKSFTGAELAYAELAAAEDPRRLALAFCRERGQALS
jgi:hypothetical protein